MSICPTARCYSRKCKIGSVPPEGLLCRFYDECESFEPSDEMREANEEIAKKKETVDHPSHYQGSYECIELMEAMFGTFEMMIFCKINAYKYRFRTGRKLGVDASEDIKKAEYYEKKFMVYRDQMERIV